MAKVLNTVSTIMVVIVVALAVLLVGFRFIGFDTYIVLSGSMEPAYKAGSLIYTRDAEPEDIEVGDVITFQLAGGETRVTHRVVEIQGEGSSLQFITMFSTLAYLTDRDSVVNTFTVGKIDITVDETDVDRDGNKVPDQNGHPAPRVKENLYHLIPGKEYLKDPMMTVKAGSEESYVRMIMAVNNADKVQALIDADDKNGSKGEVVDYKDLFAGWDDSKWTYEGYEVVDNTIYFEFRYFERVDGFKDGK